jgi:hypothetical protein
MEHLTLQDYTNISQIIGTIVGILALISWKWMYITFIYSKFLYILNIVKREKWIWKGKKFEDILINFFSDTANVNRNFWNYCIDKKGNATSKMTLGALTWFDTKSFDMLPINSQKNLINALVTRMMDDSKNNH